MSRCHQIRDLMQQLDNLEQTLGWNLRCLFEQGPDTDEARGLGNMLSSPKQCGASPTRRRQSSA
jgi:hypothetical protein